MGSVAAGQPAGPRRGQDNQGGFEGSPMGGRSSQQEWRFQLGEAAEANTRGELTYSGVFDRLAHLASSPRG